MMLTHININAANDVPIKNAHMFVGEYNIIEDPVIHEFINNILDIVSILYNAVKMLSFVVFVHFAYGCSLCLFGWLITTLWTVGREFIVGQEWNDWWEWIVYHEVIEILFAVSSIAVTATFLKLIHDDNEKRDDFVGKLKADLAAKDKIIEDLNNKLDGETEWEDIDDEEEDDEDDVSLDEDDASLDEDDDDCDSDYDPDEDEY